MRVARLTLAVLSALSAPAFAVEIDGRIDPAEWQGAQHVTDFRQVQPLNGQPASQPTEIDTQAENGESRRVGRSEGNACRVSAIST